MGQVILGEITKDRCQDQVDFNLINEGINQFIYMGYEGKLNIKKIEGQQNLEWTCETKNLKFYE